MQSLKHVSYTAQENDHVKVVAECGAPSIEMTIPQKRGRYRRHFVWDCFKVCVFCVGLFQSLCILCGIVSKFVLFVWDCFKVCAFCVGLFQSLCILCGIVSKFVYFVWDCFKVCAFCVGLFQSLCILCGIVSKFILCGGLFQSLCILCGIVSKFVYFVWDCFKVCVFCVWDCFKFCVFCVGLFQSLCILCVGLFHSLCIVCGIVSKFAQTCKTSLGRVSLAAIPTRRSPSHGVKFRETGLNVNRLVAQ